jgi:hypothetical protein
VTPSTTPALATFALAVAIAVPGVAGAVELQGLKGHEALFGRYAPGGDCAKQPRITVDASGLSFEVAGKTEKVTNPEQALGFAGPDYQGIGVWLFPFRKGEGYAILMSFNEGEKPGTLAIGGHDEGYPGGPPASPRNAALIAGSPYARCP